MSKIGGPSLGKGLLPLHAAPAAAATAATGRTAAAALRTWTAPDITATKPGVGDPPSVMPPMMPAGLVFAPRRDNDNDDNDGPWRAADATDPYDI